MKVSAAKKAEFADLLVNGQTPEGAARAIGISRTTAYRWREADPAFAEQWDDAWNRKVENVENVLYSMAMDRDLGAVIAFLRAHKPEVYNRKMVVAVGGDPLAPAIAIDERIHFFMPPNGRDEPEVIDDSVAVVEVKPEAVTAQDHNEVVPIEDRPRWRRETF